MNLDDRTPSAADVGPSGAIATTRPRKGLVFRIGIALLVVYGLMYLFVPVAPFLPMSAPTKAAVIAGDIAAAEVILLVAIACLGKDTYRAIKSRFARKRRATTEG